MNPVLTAAQMKELDSRTAGEFGLPARILMENAGKGCADVLHNYFGELMDEGVVILCGHGNNGGDGYVLARWLDNYDYFVTLIEVDKGTSSPETIANRELCARCYLDTITSEDEDYVENSHQTLAEAGMIIDAIYGIGFTGTVAPEIRELLDFVNKMPAFKVAIDIPSGVHADTGEAVTAFRADLTLTMAAHKFGHLLGRGKAFSGVVEAIPIGIPDVLWQQEDYPILLDEAEAALQGRNYLGHKGDFGKLAVFAGSPGMTGAAFMAALAAYKAGAGLVTLFCHPDEFMHYANKPYEVMVRKTPLLPDGSLDPAAMQAELAQFDVILLGPGCGVRDYTRQLLDWLAANWEKPAIIDADGLNTLAANPDLITALSGKPFVLTPHWGEFSRLSGVGMDKLHKDCLTPLKAFVNEFKLKVLLKSHTSIFYDGEIMYINTAGNDGLAKGGSGDILAGLISGFACQQIDLPEAAGFAAWHLGHTAELLAEKKDTRSITPADILDYIFRIDEVEDEQIEY